MDTSIAGEVTEIRLDIDQLTDEQLETLARLVCKKLREAIRQETERAGRF